MITKIEIQTGELNKVLNLSSVESDSPTPLVSITIGTTGREIDPTLALMAIKNAKNGGLKPNPLFSSKNTVKEDLSLGGEVLFENHPSDLSKVIVSISSDAREVLFQDLNRALMVYSRK